MHLHLRSSRREEALTSRLQMGSEEWQGRVPPRPSRLLTRDMGTRWNASLPLFAAKTVLWNLEPPDVGCYRVRGLMHGLIFPFWCAGKRSSREWAPLRRELDLSLRSLRWRVPEPCPDYWKAVELGRHQAHGGSQRAN